jgi:hypothetical protein
METKKQKRVGEFTHYQAVWISRIEQIIEHGNKEFKEFAKDPSQIPCLLMMNMIIYLKHNLKEKDYNFFKDITHDMLEGEMPERKPYLEVVK